ncbi:MAG TPA: D-2-hydroxyacid dehydrogenase [Thermoanaerobaculia bacterium]|nr:D-2-hydroxyacid dehydrogenase [Thermoanaerobaculia bacterium]HXK66931.1 D-2-hydroxyacid dehydrogenase [Thermoanaerobaculia bacterium]
MKVLICDPVDDKAIARMRDAGLDVTVKTGMTPEELLPALSGFEAVVVRSATKIRKDAIDAADALKVVVRGGVGVDNIDVAYAREKGVEVRNTPAASSDSVAELAVGMMFALARQIGAADRSMREEKWEKKKFKGIELSGKTLGVIGIGRIGLASARRAHALGMSVVAYDAFINQVSEPFVSMVSLEELLERSHFITLHIPFDPTTGAVLGAAEFSKMKDGVYIINCARGGVVDEPALLEALNSGKVAGAGIDVYAKEPTENWNLVKHPSVICTPHIGASTREGQARVGGEVADILIEYAGRS